jgi:RNA polymerase sigma-70 factor (ECF subfamily)
MMSTSSAVPRGATENERRRPGGERNARALQRDPTIRRRPSKDSAPFLASSVVDLREEALERLYRARYTRFRDGLATVTGSYDTAHDVVQDAFAHALTRRNSFRGDGSLEGWVWRIAFRLALRRRSEPAEGWLVETIVADVVDPARDPQLTEALRTLPPRKRLLVFLHYFADLPYAEIARICGISEGTVGATLAQARSALRQVVDLEEVQT